MTFTEPKGRIMPGNELIQQKNSDAIYDAIKKLEEINYDTVSELIPLLLAKGGLELDHCAYTPADPTIIEARGIGRYLIYDHFDPTNPFSIWVFALAPRQKTSIHDHQYKGTVTVLEGPVSEKYYLPTTGNFARLIDRADRYRFHSTKDNLDDTFVHQLKRRKGLGDGTSITLHIYNMEAKVITPEGGIIDNRNLNKIYIKDKNLDEDGTSLNKGEYHQLHSPFQLI